MNTKAGKIIRGEKSLRIGNIVFFPVRPENMETFEQNLYRLSEVSYRIGYGKRCEEVKKHVKSLLYTEIPEQE